MPEDYDDSCRFGSRGNALLVFWRKALTATTTTTTITNTHIHIQFNIQALALPAGKGEKKDGEAVLLKHGENASCPASKMGLID